MKNWLKKLRSKWNQKWSKQEGFDVLFCKTERYVNGQKVIMYSYTVFQGKSHVCEMGFSSYEAAESHLWMKMLDISRNVA